MRDNIYFDELKYVPEVVLNEKETTEYLKALKYFTENHFLIGLLSQLFPLNFIFSKKVRKFQEKTKAFTDFNERRNHYIFYQMAHMLANDNYDITINGNYVFVILGQKMFFSKREIPESVFKTMRVIAEENKIKEKSDNVISFPSSVKAFNVNSDFNSGKNNVIYLKNKKKYLTFKK